MSVKDAIIATQPTSYWPLDDVGGSSSCHDEMGLHDASLPVAGVTLSVLPFGAAQAPFFNGALGSVITIPDDPHYSQPFANALTVATWLCPLALNNANVVGGQDKYVHYVEKVFVENWFRAKQRSVPGNTPVQIADSQSYVVKSGNSAMFTLLNVQECLVAHRWHFRIASGRSICHSTGVSSTGHRNTRLIGEH